MKNPSDETIKELLNESRTIAVVGLSADPSKASYRVAEYLQSRGYAIIPVNPAKKDPILGVAPVASLGDIAVPVDIVDVFRPEADIPAVAAEAIGLRPRAFWQQLELASEAAHRLVTEAGILGVFDRCLKREHERLFPA